MADRGHAGGGGLAGRVTDLGLQRAPGGGGVAGEVDGGALVGPRPGGQPLLAAVTARLERAVGTGDGEAPADGLVGICGVLLVDPRVGSDTRQRGLGGVAAPVQPPEVIALLVHRLMQVHVRLELVRVAPVEGVAVTGTAARGGRTTTLVQLALGGRLGLRELRVAAQDARVDVERVVQPLGRGPVEEPLRIRELGLVDLPTAPRVGRLEVRVGNQDIERHALGAEGGQDPVLVVGGGAVDVLRVPDAVRPLGKQFGRTGQGGQVGQRPLVVVSVAEDITVLVRRPALGGALGDLVGAGVVQGRGGVVEEVPAVLVQQAGCGGRCPVVAVDAVEAAAVATERQVRLRGR